jgi:Domain of unknown function (DUF4145)
MLLGMSRTVQPSIDATAFSCPHCSVSTTQFWFQLFADQFTDDLRHPRLLGEEDRKLFRKSTEIADAAKISMYRYIDKVQTGEIFLHGKRDRRESVPVENIHLSRCFDCNRMAVWVHDRLIFPSTKSGVLPNPDLLDDALRDFEEAREIVNASPRGAAALLRLCVQKLCKHLGGTGKDLDDDIASLVKQGLNPTIQKSLDIVRVIGNEAVHPGVLDLKDDRNTALRLFELINSIVDQMISHPKVVSALYEKLPEGKRKRIEERDGKARQR